VLLAAASAAVDASGKQAPPQHSVAPADEMAAGARLYREHCATCHGVDGRGNGPMVATLLRRPPDLTRYANNNGGVFPDARLYRLIDGRDMAAHGSHEMPVWGRVFLREGPDAAAAQEKVDALVKYLAAMQRRAG
jgi:mono/diheme cytochrome c family protein